MGKYIVQIEVANSMSFGKYFDEERHNIFAAKRFAQEISCYGYAHNFSDDEWVHYLPHQIRSIYINKREESGS